MDEKKKKKKKGGHNRSLSEAPASLITGKAGKVETEIVGEEKDYMHSHGDNTKSGDVKKETDLRGRVKAAFYEREVGSRFDTSGLNILELDFWIQDSDDDASLCQKSNEIFERKENWTFDTQLLSINGGKLGDLGGQGMAPSLPIHRIVARISPSKQRSEDLVLENSV
ncbi:hypothetical protein CDAR_569751 [Caerostris darwini]|uniref:Uncharacterized protein n=1 Tax=Caerostris darwini TaxID=1538125 RepID=A0AAV4RZP9_9ARAC|nr:hypothetical protein CDAR_569751 [Caerostris darwini]